MVDILHRIGIKNGTAEATYEAIATRDGIASWWISDTRGDAAKGSVLDIGTDMQVRVAELRPREHVDWEVIRGPEEWLGTHITFDITQDGDYTILLFKHRGWAEPVEFMHHCSTKWAVFLISLKQLLETGTGTPGPHDPHIDNWS